MGKKYVSRHANNTGIVLLTWSTNKNVGISLLTGNVPFDGVEIGILTTTTIEDNNSLLLEHTKQ